MVITDWQPFIFITIAFIFKVTVAKKELHTLTGL